VASTASRQYSRLVLRRLYEATWGRIVALSYDWFMSSSEEAGLRERRRELLGAASGRCLEIGAGTGLNLDLWPESVESLVLTEPDEHMAAQLRKRVARARRSVEVAEASGERLPFKDASFDTVAVTLVLCTAPDPASVLREIARVLKPEGRLLFLEHVRAQDPTLARWQDRLHGPWYAFAYGCNCNRDTLATVADSPLEVEGAEHGEMPKAPPIVKPMLWGTARAPGRPQASRGG
jgi:SAM-dependent methyltransferase